MIIPKKSKPLTRPQVQAIKPDALTEDKAYARNKHGVQVSRYLVIGPKKDDGRQTMIMVPNMDKDGKPLARRVKEYAPELGKYIVKMVRG